MVPIAHTIVRRLVVVGVNYWLKGWFGMMVIFEFRSSSFFREGGGGLKSKRSTLLGGGRRSPRASIRSRTAGRLGFHRGSPGRLHAGRRRSSTRFPDWH